MKFLKYDSKSQGVRHTGVFCLLVFSFLVMAVPFPAGGNAFAVTGQRMTSAPIARVSWDELVKMEAAKPPAAEQMHRVAPFMPMPKSQEIGSADDQPTPPDALLTPGSGFGTKQPPIITNFQALPDSPDDAGWWHIPPDTHGAVGRNFVMTMLNSQVRIQTRNGAIVNTVGLDTFWEIPTGANDVYDPRLIYDQSEDRWMATCDSDPGTAASSVLFAISDTDDPAGTWTFYRIDADPTNTDWADFPDIGFNNTWIAITNNMFPIPTGNMSGTAMWVIDKSTALAGGPLTFTFFPVGSDNFGGREGASLRVCQTFGPEPTLYLVDRRWMVGDTHVLRLTEITGTAASPIWSATPGSNIPGFPGTGWFFVINNFDWNQIGASQLGTAVRVETNDPRILNAVFRLGHIWCTHSGGLPVHPVDPVDRTAVFWYELDPTAMPAPIVQSGVLDGGPDVHHFFPSITANYFGDAFIGFSRSDDTRFVEAVYTGRMSTDPLGWMGPISVLTVGEDSYVKDFGSGRVRWGDYSATVVDPVDDLSFWTIQEYAALDVGPNPNDDRWGTWWGSTGEPEMGPFFWVVLFDVSGSMQDFGRLERARTYAINRVGWIIDQRPNDMIALATFAGTPQWGEQPFTLIEDWNQDEALLVNLIQNIDIPIRFWTPLADAACVAADKLIIEVPVGSRRLVLITDGGENSSNGWCAGTLPPGPPAPPRWHADPDPNPPWCDDDTPTDMSWHCAVWNTLVGETIVDVAYFGNLGTVKGGSGTIDGGSPKGPDEKFLRDLTDSTDGTYYDPEAITTIKIPNTEECVNPGDYVCLPILLDNNTTPFGGFELEVEFDYTSMTFVDAEPGELIEGFEKFTYRLLPCPSCGCCKYKILLYGQYDMPDGVENIGDPIPMTLVGEYKELVSLCFVVNNDENLRGLKIPVCWEWEGTVVNDTLVEDWECGENTFSSWSGDTLYTSSLLCQFNPDICDDPGDRIQPILVFQQGICGQNCGGVDICPAGPGLCKRGDINMNDMTYEVADAVLFASYFVEGTVVFRYDEAYQICATDVNADGRTLTLSDLVYLIRVILHDAVAMPKLTPSSEVANVIVYNGTISTECASPIGAILFEFDSAVSPTLLADMEMVHKGNKVLVWSSTGKSFSTSEVLSFTGEAVLVSVTAVDRDSRELSTAITGKVAPITFALHPAYPNPFNPYTNLSFNLPENVDYSLKIYNVAGQLVRTYEGMGSVGLNMITWDSKDNTGVEVASGVYFYKLTAGGFSATEKMVILK